MKKVYEGKIIEIPTEEQGQTQQWLIIRQLQPQGLSYHYGVYILNPDIMIHDWRKKDIPQPSSIQYVHTTNNLTHLANMLNITLPSTITPDQLGNLIWESI